MSYLVLCASRNPNSLSRVLGQEAARALHAAGHDAELLDLASLDLPLCDGDAAYEAPAVAELAARIRAARGIAIATPIYNYDVNAALKNLVELTGQAWENKTVAFLCAAGGRASYMSVMGLANSLMLDFRCLVIPRFVYATGEDFNEEGALRNAEIPSRVAELAAQLIRVAEALREG